MIGRRAAIAAVAVVSLVATGLWYWDSTRVKSGRIHDMLSEAEKRWWTNETECTLRLKTTCGANCSTTYCAAWNSYRQEHVDDADWVLNVLGEDSWGDMKMRRVYLDEQTWSNQSQGGWWDNVETPGQGDWHALGRREE